MFPNAFTHSRILSRRKLLTFLFLAILSASYAQIFTAFLAILSASYAQILQFSLPFFRLLWPNFTVFLAIFPPFMPKFYSFPCMLWAQRKNFLSSINTVFCLSRFELGVQNFGLLEILRNMFSWKAYCLIKTTWRCISIAFLLKTTWRCVSIFFVWLICIKNNISLFCCEKTQKSNG